ncbi:MAG: resuscitation-promoting factor RpfA [Pseudonocardiales bacterium]|nr:resuscitation-promoting factor RpfA [Pseudonocardiales bacterium]
MARYRGRHRAPSTTGRTLARTAVAGAVLTAPVVVAPAASADTASAWDRLAQCESTGNWAINTGNGFSGGLQFTPSTWRAFGGSGLAHHASREQQIAVAERVLAKQGWGAWPACSRKLGLRGTPKPSAVKAAPQAKPSTSTATAAPAPSGRTVTVARGDTLARIASAHGVSGGWQALKSANPGLRNPNVLGIGAVLQLP